MKRKGWLPLCLATSLLLSGCSLLPAEEEFQASPVIHSYVEETFNYAYVEKGDIARTTKLTCIYMPAKSQSYKFKASGEVLDEIYVKVGDTVEEGQLLAQLYVADYLSAIDDVQCSIDRLELQISQLEQWRKVELARCTDAASTAAVMEDYDARRQSLDDALYIQNLQLSEYEYQLSRRRIYADFAGTVTFVRNVDDGYRSSSYESLVTVADSASSTFQVSTEYWEELPVGSTHSISVAKAEYSATVVDETSLGLEKEERVPGKKANVYLVLNEITFDLEDGDRGSLLLVLDERSNVLKLPSGAVSRLNGKNVVYYLDENGTKRYKEVECGLEGGKEVEIISGVTEGEAVITE